MLCIRRVPVLLAALTAAGILAIPKPAMSQDSDTDATSRKPAPQAALSMDIIADQNGPIIGRVTGVRHRWDTPFWQQKGCEHGHRSEVAYKRILGLVRHVSPHVNKGRVRHYATCLDTRAKAHRAHVLARAFWKWRHRYAQLWTIRLNRMPAGWVQWARNITACESTWNRYASNGSHFSYFQFSAPTWASASAGFDAPSSPFDASWPHQAVIAIHWAWRAGVSQWVCKG